MNNIIRKPFKYTNSGIVYWLIGINILIFLFLWLLAKNFYSIASWGGIGERLIMLGDFLLIRMPMRPALVLERGWVWTFITYMFMHAGFRHILFNMFGLFIFGIHVERQMGSREFLLYYLLTGALAGVFSCFAYYFTSSALVPLVGASGAIFAVELAYAVLFPDSIIYLWGIIPLRAPVMVLGFTALELILSLTEANSNVAHLTHLAGFAFGWIYFLIRFGMNPWRRLTGR